MVEIIGLIVWLLFNMSVTAFPFLMIAMSGLGGGMDRVDWLIVCCIILIALFSWYNFFTLINITVN